MYVFAEVLASSLLFSTLRARAAFASVSCVGASLLSSVRTEFNAHTHTRILTHPHVYLHTQIGKECMGLHISPAQMQR